TWPTIPQRMSSGRWLPLLSILPGIPIASALIAPSVPFPVKLAIGVVLLTTVCSPVEGFLTAVLLAPLGGMMASALDVAEFRLTEAVLLSFLTVWLAKYRPSTRPRPTPPAAVMRSVWLLIGVVAASAIGVLWHLARSSPPGGEGLFPAVTEF